MIVVVVVFVEGCLVVEVLCELIIDVLVLLCGGV